MNNCFAPVDELIHAIRNGDMIIMVDDEDRENEGDLIMAAKFATAEHINFMAKYGRGLICLTLTEERCRQLNLPLMVQNTNQTRSTNFTVSIDAREKITTGISAPDRARTISVAIDAKSTAADLVQPGHIFPLMSKDGGVLYRAGHTEAGCDITKLAEAGSAAVIVEILNEDGSMARRSDLEQFSKQHGILMGTIADLIRFRLQNEMTVYRVLETEIEHQYGHFHLVVYKDRLTEDLHYALHTGTITTDFPPLVRVHVENPISDLIGIRNRIAGWPLNDAIKRIASEKSGIIVILSGQIKPHQLIASLKQQEQPLPRKDSEVYAVGLGSQILHDLGAHKIRVLSPPKKLHAISGFNLEIVEYVCDA